MQSLLRGKTSLEGGRDGVDGLVLFARWRADGLVCCCGRVSLTVCGCRPVPSLGYVWLAKLWPGELARWMNDASDRFHRTRPAEPGRPVDPAGFEVAAYRPGVGSSAGVLAGTSATRCEPARTGDLPARKYTLATLGAGPAGGHRAAAAWCRPGGIVDALCLGAGCPWRNNDASVALAALASGAALGGWAACAALRVAARGLKRCGYSFGSGYVVRRVFCDENLPDDRLECAGFPWITLRAGWRRLAHELGLVSTGAITELWAVARRACSTPEFDEEAWLRQWRHKRHLLAEYDCELRRALDGRRWWRGAVRRLGARRLAYWRQHSPR
jgi:hypothetical protein